MKLTMKQTKWFDFVRKHIVKNKPVNISIKYYKYPNYGFVKERIKEFFIKKN